MREAAEMETTETPVVKRRLQRRHSGSVMIAALEEHEREAEATAELRKALEEKEIRIDFLEREIKALKQVNAKSEMKVRELERRLFISEMKEMEEISKKVRVEESLRENVEEKEREIGRLTEKIEDLDNAFRECEERAKMMEWVVIGLREQVREAERLIGVAPATDAGVGFGGGGGDGCDGEEKRVDLPWPLVVQGLGFAGAVSAVAAVIYFWFGKHKSFFVIRR